MKLSIVIPVYNEVHYLPEIIRRVQSVRLPSGVKGREIVIVDDASTDGTTELLKNLKKRDVRVFFHATNQGKGAGLRTGFAASRGDVVLVQDADLEYDPAEYPRLLAPILDGRADVVYGSRFAGGQPHRVLYFWHMVANRFLTLLSNMFSDLNLTDMETCYKVFRRTILDRISIRENRFGFEPEITAKVARLVQDEGLRIYEVGISYSGRTYAEGKKIGLKDAFRACWCIFKYSTSAFARLVKYGIVGTMVFGVQVITIIAIVEGFGLRGSVSGENIAHLLSAEVSILFAFFMHSVVTWNYQFDSARELLSKFFQFHVITLLGLAIRQSAFYALSLAAVDYRINTAVSVAIAVLINFLGYQSIVFRRKAPVPSRVAGSGRAD